MIHILTCFYRRPQITRLYIAGIKRLIKESAISFSGTFVASEPDDLKLLREIAPKGFDVYEFPNNPVSNKHNFALQKAMEKEWSELLIMGSDDLISTFGVDLLYACEKPYRGFNKIAFYHSEFKEWKILTYDKPRLIGCGRMIKRSVIENIGKRMYIEFGKDHSIGGVDYKARFPVLVNKEVGEYLIGIGFARQSGNTIIDYKLWENDLDRALDHSSEMRLAMAGYAPHIIDAPIQMIDIKSETNITNYTKLPYGLKTDDLDWFLGEEERFLFRSL